MLQHFTKFLEVHQQWFGFKLSALMTIIVLGIAFQQPAFLEKIELKILDERFIIRGPIPIDDRVVILAVDDDSLSEIGRWPWPRDKIATLVERVLGEYGAAVIGFDVVFSEPQENPLKESVRLLEQGRRENAAVSEWLNRNEQLGDMDGTFEAVLSKYADRIVQGYFFYPDGADASSRLRSTLKRDSELMQPSAFAAEMIGDVMPSIPRMIAVEGNLPRFMKSTDVSGYFNFFPDEDGMVRRVPLVAELDGFLYPNLGLQALRVAMGWPSLSVRVTDVGVEDISIDGHSIPVGPDGGMLLNHYGPGKSFRHVRASDVLMGRIDASVFEDAIVLLGVTAVGVFDHRPSPYDSVFPGVEGHAAGIANLLNNNYIKRPLWIKVFEFLGLLILGLACGRLIIGRGPMVQGMTIIGLPILIVILAIWLFSSYGIWMKTIYLVLGVLMSTMPVTLIEYIVEARKRVFIHDAFAHYLAPNVVNDLAAHPELLNLGGEEKELTAFFSDIAAFSSFSENLRPTDLVQFLNKYLSAMSDIILARGGTIDKYEGDAIIAFFGAPLDMPDHAYQCTMAAIEQQQALFDLRRQWAEEGLPEVNIRIGLSSGPIVVGNMGTVDRMDYTIMGAHVNLASRLEGVCKQYRVPILISGDTFNIVKERIVARFVDRVRVVGCKTPVDLYEPLGGHGNVGERELAFVASYQEAWNAMDNRDFESAMNKFGKLQADHPGDWPTRILLERVNTFMQKAPPKDWDGVHTLDSK